MLNKMKDEGVFSVALSEDKTKAIFTKSYQRFYEVELNKLQMKKVIAELNELQKQMVFGVQKWK